jgi:hypothetical protein
VVPPFDPAQVQIHAEEPSSVTAEGAPTLHRPVVGALLTVVPFAGPQAPLTGVLPDELPELLDPDELPELLDAPPELELPELLLEELEPDDEPELLELDPVFDAMHCAVVPPLLPLQLQSHGPLPETADAVPALHRPVVGLLLRLSPFADPHAPLTGCGFRDAVHCAVFPPFVPTQLQSHGPLPLTEEVVPALHRPVVGLLLRLSPFADPHAPLTGFGGSEIPDELLVAPPLELPELEPPELDPDELELPGCFCSICWICCSSC